MTVRFMCCCGSKEYYLPDNMAGQRVRCPNCQMIIVVPQPNDAISMAMPADDSSTE